MHHGFSIINSKIEEIDIDIYEILIGANLPNFDVNYPLLVDLSNRVFGIDIINISEHDKFRE